MASTDIRGSAATRRFAGLEGWWIMAGILAIIVLAFLKLTLFA